MEIKNYQKKLSGPIIDRIDMWVEVNTVEYEKLNTVSTEEKSHDVAKRVTAARTFLYKTPENIAPDAQKILETSAKRLKLSARAYYKTIKIAKTIASMERRTRIETKDVLEALQYRPKI